MKVVLKPYWIAEDCFLQEAVMWAAFYRFPTSEIVPDHVDYRFDANVQDEYHARVAEDYGYIESEEAVRVGLPPNPEWEALMGEDIGDSDPEFIKMQLDWNIPEVDKEKLRLDLPKAEKRAILQAEWDEKYEEHIEIIESKLFVALKEGKLSAEGRRIPDPMEDGKYWTDFEHEPIPPDHWRIEGIDWAQSASKNPKGHYCHICVKTDQLFALFPPPPSEQTKDVKIVADQYVLNDEATERIIPKGKRGRPSYDWESFYIEVMVRVKADDLPDKQESFISEMQAWCLEHWGVEVGRSTILEKVSPIYKKFKDQ